jgi:hypothetical protein
MTEEKKTKEIISTVLLFVVFLVITWARKRFNGFSSTDYFEEEGIFMRFLRWIGLLSPRVLTIQEQCERGDFYPDKIPNDGKCIEFPCDTLIEGSRFVNTLLPLQIPKNKFSLTSPGSMTIMCWLKVERGPTGNWRSILHRGINNQQRSPAIWMRPNSMQMKLSLNSDVSGDDGLESTEFTVPLNEWFHFAWVQFGQSMRLYVNGTKTQVAKMRGSPRMLDVPMLLPGTFHEDHADVNIGNLYWCGTRALEDEAVLRIYQKELVEFS